MTTRETARRLLLLRVIKDRIAEVDAHERAAAGTDFDRAGVRDIGLVGDDQLGAVWLAKGRVTPKVTDPAALLAWCIANRPSEVETVTRVRESYKSALLMQAKTDGYAHADGEIIPGITVDEGDPILNVKPVEGAAQVVEAAFAAGELTWADVLPAAIEATS